MRADELLKKMESEFSEAHLGGNPVVMYVRVIADRVPAKEFTKEQVEDLLIDARYCEEKVEVWEKP